MTRIKESQKTLQLQKGGADHAQSSQKAKQLDDDLIQRRAFLPDELIEKIIARMGFPAVFKARLLSKSWYTKLAFLARKDVILRSLSQSLRNEMVSVSSRWTTYCPTFFNLENILGYDRVSSTWKVMSLDPFDVSYWSSVTILASAGSLLCTVGDDSRIIVSNFLSGIWQEVVTSDDHDMPEVMPDHVRILQAGADRYMVVLLHQDGVQIKTFLCDSSCETWTTTLSGLENLDGPQNPGIFVNNSAYLDGKLSCLCLGRREEDPCQLWAHHVTDPGKSWTVIPHTFGSETVVEGGIFLCGEKVIVVIWCTDTSAVPYSIPVELERIKRLSRNLYTLSNVIRIYELNVDTLVLMEVCKGPPKIVSGVGLHREEISGNDYGGGHYEPQIQYASDADYIYFAQANPSAPVMTYDVHSHKWGFLPPPCYTFGSSVDEWSKMGQFAPGLNPFAIV